MVSNEDLLNMSIEDLAKEIAESQKRTALLFQIMGSRIFKKTEGESFMKDENVNVAEYWLKVAEDYPDIIARDKNMADFASKIIFFNALVALTTQDEQIGEMLKMPRDIVSKDCAAYASYIRKQVLERKSDPVFKLILDREPSPRKTGARKQPPTNPPTTP